MPCATIWKRRASSLLLAALVAAAACPAEDAPPPGRDLAPPRADVWPDAGHDGPRHDAPPPPPPDLGVPIDLPTLPRDRCLAGKCGASLICFEERCYVPCTQADPKCNDKSAQCAATEACQPAGTGFICLPAQPPGADCSNGKLCEGGSLCASTSGATLCRKLCKYGCGALNCGKTPTGCDICF